MTNEEIKRKFIAAHREMSHYWASGIKYYGCPICKVARMQTKVKGSDCYHHHCQNDCTQGGSETECNQHKTFCFTDNGTIRLDRAEYHRRVVAYLESLPAVTFEDMSIIQEMTKKIDQEVYDEFKKREGINL